MAETGDIPQNFEEKGIVPIGRPYSKNKYETPTRLTDKEYVRSVLNKGENEPTIKVWGEPVDDEEQPGEREPLPRIESRRPEQGTNSMFEPTWLVGDEAELKSVKSESLRMRIGRLHEAIHDASTNPDLMGRDDWRAEYLSLMRDANQDRYPEDNEAIRDFLIRINDQVGRMAQESENLNNTAGPEFRREKTRIPFQSSWFMRNEADLDRVISDDLRSRLEFLNAMAAGNAFTKGEWRQQYYNFLQEVYTGEYPGEDPSLLVDLQAKMAEKIENMLDDTQPFSEAAAAMHEAASAQQAMARGEALLQVEGLGIEEQRGYVRQLLDRIERSNRDTHDPANNLLVRGLETSLSEMWPEVAKEVRARLAVYDCSELIKQADGWVFRESDKVGPGYAIGSAAAEAERRNHSLNREVIETLLIRENMPGLDVARAWDILQGLNYEYENWVESAKRRGFLKGVKNRDEGIFRFFQDSNSVRKKIMENYAVSILKTSPVFSTLEETERQNAAEKSFQLAQALARASLEESVFNRGKTTTNDQLAEVLGLKEWRADRRNQGRIRGPEIHEDEVEGFGASWLRRATGNIDLTKKLTSADIIKNVNELKADWQFYCSVIVTRYKQLNELLLDRKPKPGEMGLTFLQNAVVYFNTADKPEPNIDDLIILYPELNRLSGGARNQRIKTLKETEGYKQIEANWKSGPQNLRVWWVAGVIDMALTEVDLGWDQPAISDFARALYLTKLSDSVGSFITPKQWAWVEKATNLKGRLIKLMAKRVFKQASQKI